MTLKGRSFLTLKDYSKDEILYLIKLASELKAKKKGNGSMALEGKLLEGKNIVLLFDKTSTRTRCSFEVAAYDEGAHVTYLTNSQMGKKESLEDTAKVLGRLYDGIEYRGFAHSIVEDLAAYSGVPVWNGLTDDDHPTQVLADFLTAEEHLKKPLDQMKLPEVISVLYGVSGEDSIETIGEAVAADFLRRGTGDFSDITVENLLERV